MAPPDGSGGNTLSGNPHSSLGHISLVANPKSSSNAEQLLEPPPSYVMPLQFANGTITSRVSETYVQFQDVDGDTVLDAGVDDCSISSSECSSTTTAGPVVAPLVMTRYTGSISFVSRVPHFQQLFSWDCGLACVLMVVQALGFKKCTYDVLRQLCPITSIWTVDLAHLLRRLVPPHLGVSLLTVTLGPNPEYAHENFYAQHMQEDELRVSQLFVAAATAGIDIQQRSVDNAELQALLLDGDYLVIALVDKRKLDARDDWLAAADACLPSLCGGAMDMGYAGHYIVLVGFDPTTCQFLVRDPASPTADLRVSAATVDTARRCFGTDEDLLIVSTKGGVTVAEYL